MELVKNPVIAQRFPDLHPALDARAAVVEANRCLNCFDAPCMGACPTHIDVPGFIRKIAANNISGSARTILDANILGASCARVCPVDVLCEGACVLHGKHQKPIEIGRLQRFATETFYDSGGRLALRQRHRAHRARVVHRRGAGQPGLCGGAASAGLSGARHRPTPAARWPQYLRRGGVQAARQQTACARSRWSAVSGVDFEASRRGYSIAGATGTRLRCNLSRRGPGRYASPRCAGFKHSVRVIDALKFIAALQVRRSAKRGPPRGGHRRGQYRNRRGLRRQTPWRRVSHHCVPPPTAKYSRIRLRVRPRPARGG